MSQDEVEPDVEPGSPVEPKIDTSKFELLPTGKCHVSFSESRDWQDCTFRHKLKHVLGINLDKPGPLMDFGTAVHAACESYLKTRVMDHTIATAMIRKVWDENKEIPGFEPKTLDAFIDQATGILMELPGWFDEQFPGWEYVDAEHFLYEEIPDRKQAFKGYIDCIIKCKNKKGKDVYWVIDWKTSSWGWKMQKKCDPNVRSQIVLYKTFWCKKMGIDIKDVKCGFVILKRTAKATQRCELLEVSAGDVTIGRSLAVIKNMVNSVKRGIALKNRSSCLYCPYKGTEHCT